MRAQLRQDPVLLAAGGVTSEPGRELHHGAEGAAHRLPGSHAREDRLRKTSVHTGTATTTTETHSFEEKATIMSKQPLLNRNTPGWGGGEGRFHLGFFTLIHNKWHSHPRVKWRRRDLFSWWGCVSRAGCVCRCESPCPRGSVHVCAHARATAPHHTSPGPNSAVCEVSGPDTGRVCASVCVCVCVCVCV